MNLLDLILLIPMMYLGFKGFNRGLVGELASIIGLVLGIYACLYFSGTVKIWVSEAFETDGYWVGIAAFAITFIGVLLGVRLIAKALSKILDMAALGIVNKMLGTAFGIFKALLILSALLLVVNAIEQYAPFLPQEKVKGSMLYEPLSKFALKVFPFLEENEVWKSFLEGFQNLFTTE